jgi:hypothetical protein
MEKILLELNKIIEDNYLKIEKIYGFVKLFDKTRITSKSLNDKRNEITTHCNKSTESRCLHGRSLGSDQTELSATILAGFDLNLYNCEYVDIATGECTKDYDSDLVQTKENNYFNMIINWYKMKAGGLDNSYILENLDSLYSNCAKDGYESICVISG